MSGYGGAVYSAGFPGVYERVLSEVDKVVAGYSDGTGKGLCHVFFLVVFL